MYNHSYHYKLKKVCLARIFSSIFSPHVFSDMFSLVYTSFIYLDNYMTECIIQAILIVARAAIHIYMYNHARKWEGLMLVCVFFFTCVKMVLDLDLLSFVRLKITDSLILRLWILKIQTAFAIFFLLFFVTRRLTWLNTEFFFIPSYFSDTHAFPFSSSKSLALIMYYLITII